MRRQTVLKLIADVGAACADLHDRWFRDLPCQRVQIDEMWSFVGMKAKNVPAEMRNTFGFGDVWTWIAIDADTKLVISWLVADRSQNSARMMMRSMTRLTNAFSKKVENQAHQHAINFAYCNFCRIHKTLRFTPAIASGITSTVWSLVSYGRGGRHYEGVGSADDPSSDPRRVTAGRFKLGHYLKNNFASSSHCLRRAHVWTC